MNINPLSCDCYMYAAMMDQETAISDAVCSTPVPLAGTVFTYASRTSPSYFQKKADNLFLCCE